MRLRADAFCRINSEHIGVQPDRKIQTAGGDFLTNVVQTVIVQTVRIFVVNREPLSVKKRHSAARFYVGFGDVLPTVYCTADGFGDFLPVKPDDLPIAENQLDSFAVVVAEAYRVVIPGTAADSVFIFQKFREFVFAGGVLGNVLAYAEFSVRKAASADNFIFKEFFCVIAVWAYFLRNIRKNRNGI